jgi:hypothetical protein
VELDVTVIAIPKIGWNSLRAMLGGHPQFTALRRRDFFAMPRTGRCIGFNRAPLDRLAAAYHLLQPSYGFESFTAFIDWVAAEPRRNEHTYPPDGWYDGLGLTAIYHLSQMDVVIRGLGAEPYIFPQHRHNCKDERPAWETLYTPELRQQVTELYRIEWGTLPVML